MAATEAAEAAVAARDATRLESPVCFFVLFCSFITLILFLDLLTTSKQQQQHQQQRLETRLIASRAAGIIFYFYYYTNDYFRLIYMRMKAWNKRGLEMRCISSPQVCSLFLYIFYYTNQYLKVLYLRM